MHYEYGKMVRLCLSLPKEVGLLRQSDIGAAAAARQRAARRAKKVVYRIHFTSTLKILTTRATRNFNKASDPSTHTHAHSHPHPLL